MNKRDTMKTRINEQRDLLPSSPEAAVKHVYHGGGRVLVHLGDVRPVFDTASP